MSLTPLPDPLARTPADGSPSGAPIRLERCEASGARARIALDASYAGFDGHFPGAPVLPAMCHVDLALRVARLACDARVALAEVARSRFVRPVRPDETLVIELAISDRDDGTLKIDARHTVDGERAAEILMFAARACD